MILDQSDDIQDEILSYLKDHYSDQNSISNSSGNKILTNHNEIQCIINRWRGGKALSADSIPDYWSSRQFIRETINNQHSDLRTPRHYDADYHLLDI